MQATERVVIQTEINLFCCVFLVKDAYKERHLHHFQSQKLQCRWMWLFLWNHLP